MLTPCRDTGSDLLHVLERLAARAAAAEGLAGGGAELALLHRVGRAAQRAGGRAAGGAQLRRVRSRGADRGLPGRGDPAGGQLAAAVGADPVGGPGGGEHGAHVDVGEPGPVQRVHQVGAHDPHRRAAGVGGGDLDDDGAVLGPHVAQHAEVGEGEHRQLRIGHRLGDRTGIGPAEVATSAGHQVAAGCCRASPWSVPSSSVSSAVCSPARPRGGASAGQAGTVSVARPSTWVSTSATSSRTVDGSTATPAAVSPASTSVAGKTSPSGGQTAWAPAWARRCDSSVPSPRRSTQRAAWSRWYVSSLTPLAAIAASTGSRDSRSRAKTASRAAAATSSRIIVRAKSPSGASTRPVLRNSSGGRK